MLNHAFSYIKNTWIETKRVGLYKEMGEVRNEVVGTEYMRKNDKIVIVCH